MAERYARPNEEAMKRILAALDSAGTEALTRVRRPDDIGKIELFFELVGGCRHAERSISHSE
jgi:hypothetical protein